MATQFVIDVSADPVETVPLKLDPTRGPNLFERNLKKCRKKLAAKLALRLRAESELARVQAAKTTTEAVTTLQPLRRERGSSRGAGMRSIVPRHVWLRKDTSVTLESTNISVRFVSDSSRPTQSNWFMMSLGAKPATPMTTGVRRRNTLSVAATYSNLMGITSWGTAARAIYILAEVSHLGSSDQS